jgi:hypothetical protein
VPGIGRVICEYLEVEAVRPNARVYFLIPTCRRAKGAKDEIGVRVEYGF